MSTDQTKEGFFVLPESGMVEFGPAHIEDVPASVIIELQQTREEYTSEGIEELAASMEPLESGDGKLHFEVLHPPTLAKLDTEHLIAFLQDHGDFYGIKHDLESFSPHSDGFFYIATAGHRRRRAIIQICESAGIPLENALVKAECRMNIVFEDALGLQLRENVHLRTSALEEAKQINRISLLRQRRLGILPGVKDLMRVTGFKEDKIRSALNFALLPVSIQQLAETDYSNGIRRDAVLPYSTVVALVPLMHAYNNLYKARRELNPDNGQNDDDLIEQELVAFTYKIIRLNLSQERRQARINEIIKGQVECIKGEAQYQTGELFIMEDALPAHRVNAAARVLANNAVNALITTVSSGHDLSKDNQERLRALLSVAQELAPDPQLTL